MQEAVVTLLSALAAGFASKLGSIAAAKVEQYFQQNPDEDRSDLSPKERANKLGANLADAAVDAFLPDPQPKTNMSNLFARLFLSLIFFPLAYPLYALSDRRNASTKQRRPVILFCYDLALRTIVGSLLWFIAPTAAVLLALLLTHTIAPLAIFGFGTGGALAIAMSVVIPVAALALLATLAFACSSPGLNKIKDIAVDLVLNKKLKFAILLLMLAALVVTSPYVLGLFAFPVVAGASSLAISISLTVGGVLAVIVASVMLERLVSTLLKAVLALIVYSGANLNEPNEDTPLSMMDILQSLAVTVSDQIIGDRWISDKNVARGFPFKKPIEPPVGFTRNALSQEDGTKIPLFTGIVSAKENCKALCEEAEEEGWLKALVG